ncbi:hypothetical protein RFI_27218 [Reticulomyxa filosa]|uniref:Uncharacterized protein n=1 Tax=Reticulomyxa filosa TaxID=46433 RepID=X6M8B4_RETFI|nr:hypothetical protein RFI_27218 [Reticulomyxa filosa]|eukprot:ETO10159.1 hypothetical protein RFI_27218 [Reticulomyxa filosa]
MLFVFDNAKKKKKKPNQIKQNKKKEMNNLNDSCGSTNDRDMTTCVCGATKLKHFEKWCDENLATIHEYLRDLCERYLDWDVVSKNNTRELFEQLEMYLEYQKAHLYATIAYLIALDDARCLTLLLGAFSPYVEMNYDFDVNGGYEDVEDEDGGIIDGNAMKTMIPKIHALVKKMCDNELISKPKQVFAETQSGQYVVEDRFKIMFPVTYTSKARRLSFLGHACLLGHEKCIHALLYLGVFIRGRGGGGLSKKKKGCFAPFNDGGCVFYLTSFVTQMRAMRHRESEKDLNLLNECLCSGAFVDDEWYQSDFLKQGHGNIYTLIDASKSNFLTRKRFIANLLHLFVEKYKMLKEDPSDLSGTVSWDLCWMIAGFLPFINKRMVERLNFQRGMVLKRF